MNLRTSQSLKLVSVRLLTVPLLVLGMSQALAVETVTMTQSKSAGGAADSSRGAFYRISEHDGCNEIQTLVPEVNRDRYQWSSSSSGGRGTVTDRDLKGLNQNELDEVSFGKSNKIVFKLEGKQVVPDSLKKTEQFSHDYSSIYDHDRKVIIGKSIVLHDLYGPPGFKNKDGGYDKRGIMLGVFYYNNAVDGGTNVVSCQYVSGNIDFVAMEKGKCFWVDRKSMAANAKPYCW